MRKQVRSWWEGHVASAKADEPTFISLSSVSPGSAILQLGTSGLTFSISYPESYPDVAKPVTLRATDRRLDDFTEDLGGFVRSQRRNAVKIGDVLTKATNHS